MRDNKLYSTIYITGTALSIAMVMLVATHLYLHTGNLYPEYDRERQLYVSMLSITPKDTTQSYMSNGPMSYQTVRDCLYPLKTAKAVSASLFTFEQQSYQVTSADAPHPRRVYVKYTDPGFWQVYWLDFVAGVPFSQEQFDAAREVAVINESLANYLFPRGDAVGGSFVIKGRSYKVCGVVRDVPYQMSDSFAHIWAPFTLRQDAIDNTYGTSLLGLFFATVLPREGVSQAEAVQEIKDSFARYEEGLDVRINLMGQPDDIWSAMMRVGNSGFNMTRITIGVLCVIFLFLLIPALNLMGLGSSVLEQRMSELGVRKAFGANNRSIIQQILLENLLLTLMGSLLALLMIYAFFASDIYDAFTSVYLLYSTSSIDNVKSFASGVSMRMLLQPSIFALALLTALILNTMTSLLPAWRFTRSNIVDALSDNQASKK